MYKKLRKEQYNSHGASSLGKFINTADQTLHAQKVVWCNNFIIIVTTRKHVSQIITELTIP